VKKQKRNPDWVLNPRPPCSMHKAKYGQPSLFGFDHMFLSINNTALDRTIPYENTAYWHITVNGAYMQTPYIHNMVNPKHNK
jgi:hypothetical protein